MRLDQSNLVHLVNVATEIANVTRNVAKVLNSQHHVKGEDS